MSSREQVVQETIARIRRLEKMAARREAAKLDRLEKLLKPDDFQLVAGTEGVGLLGDIAPVTPDDWDIYLGMQLLVRALQRHNTNKELAPYLELMDAARLNLVARSFSSDVIRHEFGEFGEELGAGPPPQIAGEGKVSKK